MTIPASLTPKKLRLILLATLAVSLLGGSALFYMAYSKLNASATETGDQVAQAKQSEDTLQRLQALQKELEEQEDTVLMTSQVMADSQNYAYQDRLVSDLTTYANRAGLKVTNISFINNQASTTPAPAAQSPATAEGGADAMGANPAPVGLRKATVDITLESPTNYPGLLNFLHYVEQNLTKLKVSRVTMSKAEDGVTVDALNLEVYLR